MEFSLKLWHSVAKYLLSFNFLTKKENNHNKEKRRDYAPT